MNPRPPAIDSPRLRRRLPAALLALALAAWGGTAGAAPADVPAAKNVILMIADGIGFNGWLAADYHEGRAGRQSYQAVRPDGTRPRLYGQTHWSVNLVDADGGLLADGDAARAAGAVEQYYDAERRWKRFEASFEKDFAPTGTPYLSYTNSSSAATALNTGRKTLNGRVNQDWQGRIAFETIAQIVDRQGRATGAVSTVMASHATPAAVWSHVPARGQYADIFNQMLASGLDVIMGAGHPDYDKSGRPVRDADAKEYKYVGGAETWRALTAPAGVNGFAFIDRREQFEALARGDTLPAKVVGITRSLGTNQADREGYPHDPRTPSGMAFNDAVPDLATMTRAALNVLGQNDKGFFVMIEGGAVDWMGHANNMPRYIEEQGDFNRAVEAAIDWVERHSNWAETLLIVTADHETGGIWGAGTWDNGRGAGAVALPHGGDPARGIVSPGPALPVSQEVFTDAHYDPAADTFRQFSAVQDHGAGRLPGYQFASRHHTNELAPLWALGAGTALFDQHRRVDTRAARLWGHGRPYDWDGAYIDNTVVFEVMNQAFLNDHLREHPRAGTR